MNDLYYIIGAVGTICCLLGWSYNSIMDRLALLERSKISGNEMRRIMEDKLEAYNVAFKGLVDNVKELKDTVKELNAAIQSLNNNVFQKGNK